MKTITKAFLILLTSLAASCLFAQSGPSFGYRKPEAAIDTFVKKIEGGGYLTASVPSADGGYVTISGPQYYATSFVVRKTKVSGQKQWEKSLNFDVVTYINGIAQTKDGGYVFVGFGCKDDYCFEETGTILVKLNSNGGLAWKKSFAVPGQYYSDLNSAIATSDGGFVSVGSFTGSENDGYMVLRFTSTGDVGWIKSLEGQYGRLVSTATLDNGFILAAQTRNKTKDGVDVVKMTNSGDINWRKSLAADDFVFQSLGLTAQNQAIVIGSGANSNRLKVIVLNGDGTLSWKAEYLLKVPGKIRSVSSPIQMPDGGYVLTGTSNSGFIAKIDSSRRIEFLNTFAGLGQAIFPTPDGGFFLVATQSSNLLVMKADSKGMTGCGFFKPHGITTRTSFGVLRLTSESAAEADALSIEALALAVNSVATNYPVSTVCQ